MDYSIIEGTERQKNILAILSSIVLDGEVSAIDISKSTRLSVATVSRVINLLINESIIIRTGKEKTDMGRRPDIISLNPEYGYYLHFYIRTQKILGYLIDFNGNVLVSEQLAITREISVDDFVKRLHKLAQILVDSKNIGYEKLIAASIAIPGLVDDTNCVIKRIPNFINFKDKNLFSYTYQELQIPVIINNRARLCAVGEYIKSDPKANLAYIDFTNYNGIGAGIVLDGKLYTGKKGFAGEIGDMITNLIDFNRDHKEDEGSLETRAGVGVLYQRLSDYISVGRAKKLKEIMNLQGTNELTLELIGQAIKDEDYDVIDVLNEVVKNWAAAIINLITVINPDLIILGGVIDQRCDFLLKRIKHLIKKVLFYDVNIGLAEVESNSQILGGIYMLKKYVLSNTLKDHISRI